jgi:hypothetical protein
MALTEKLSVALGREEVRLARRAAEEEGLSLSAFVTTAIRARVAEKRREAAANAVLASFDTDDLPTPAQEAALLATWHAPRGGPARAAKRARKSR